ncbi:MAG: UvrB/UvrC motif-containing protein, partial [Clostridia bacterium]|nr:UvrB/UvrC motif-containing protein [Clostridia bacterium]
RRAIQIQYNTDHGITPTTIVKDVRSILEISTKDEINEKPFKKLARHERLELADKLEKEMKNAAKLLEFEHAAYLRDQIRQLRGEDVSGEQAPAAGKPAPRKKRRF